MPHIIVKMTDGRSDAMKQELANVLTAAMMDLLALDANAISVATEDAPAQKWMQQVYVPDIERAGQHLVKRPGYGPLAEPAQGDNNWNRCGRDDPSQRH